VVVGACGGHLLGKGEGTVVTVGAEERVGLGVGFREMVGTVELEGEPMGGFEGTSEGMAVGAFEGSLSDVSEGAIDGTTDGRLVDFKLGGGLGPTVAFPFPFDIFLDGRVVGFPFPFDFDSFLFVGGASSGRKYCDPSEVPRKILTASRPPTGVARAESVVTTMTKAAALDREAGAVFMIPLMSLTIGASSLCAEQEDKAFSFLLWNVVT
jgi:hypothetical protein